MYNSKCCHRLKYWNDTVYKAKYNVSSSKCINMSDAITTYRNRLVDSNLKSKNWYIPNKKKRLENWVYMTTSQIDWSIYLGV